MVNILMIPLFYYVQTIYGAYFLVHLNKFKAGSMEKICHHVLCQKSENEVKVYQRKSIEVRENYFQSLLK